MAPLFEVCLRASRALSGAKIAGLQRTKPPVKKIFDYRDFSCRIGGCPKLFGCGRSGRELFEAVKLFYSSLNCLESVASFSISSCQKQSRAVFQLYRAVLKLFRSCLEAVSKLSQSCLKAVLKPCRSRLEAVSKPSRSRFEADIKLT